MRIWQAWLGAGVMACCTSAQALTPADASYDDRNTKYGTFLQYGIPLVWLGLTFVLKSDDAGPGAGSGAFASDAFGEGASHWLDWNHMNGSPRHDFWLAFGRVEAFTYALKYTVPAERPNGGQHSFPSGHTSAAFMGAEFIRKEYGWWWGAPAFAAASYVGWTRQQSRNHYTRDVIAGAVLGVLCNHDLSVFTTPAGHLGLGVSLLSAGSPQIRSMVVDELGAIDPGSARDTLALVPALTLYLDFGKP